MTRPEDVTGGKQSPLPCLFCCHVAQSCFMQGGCVEALLFGQSVCGSRVCLWRQEPSPRCPGVEHLDPRRLRETKPRMWMGTQSHQVAGVNLRHGTEFKGTVTALAWDLLQDLFCLEASLQTLYWMPIIWLGPFEAFSPKGAVKSCQS